MATRVCPECGSQYVASVRTCIDCDVALIDEIDPVAAEGAPTAAKADGAQVAYELPGWGNPLKVSLEGMLDRAGIRRAWESGALVVPAEFEAEVDRLVATVEGGDIEALDDDAPQIAFEIEGLGHDELADLDARLMAAHLAHAWDDQGALLVGESDEEEVAAIVDLVLAGPNDDDEVDGLVVQHALSTLYVAVDRLMKDPDDAKDRSRYLTAAAAVDGLPVPYGLAGTDWAQLIGDVEELADVLRVPVDDEHSDDETEPVAESDAPSDPDGVERVEGVEGVEEEVAAAGEDDGTVDDDSVGDDPDGDDSDGEDPSAEDDATSGASVADRARSLRARLHELV